MELENSPTGWRAVGVCALLVVGVLGVSGGLSVAGAGVASAADAPSNADASDAPAVAAQQGNDTANVTVPVVEAMATAQNETNGTAVGAELTREGNVTDLERPSRVYEVDVLLPNGSLLVAEVNATDGSVRQVTSSEDDEGLFADLFGDDGGVPSERADPSSIRSGVDAVELVRNETGENGTVTSVELGEADGQLRYTVEVTSAEGVRSTVVVVANPEDGGILTTEADDAE